MRIATVIRNSRVAQIELSLNLDGSGKVLLSGPEPFFARRLEELARHGLFDVELNLNASEPPDGAALVAECGRALGEALRAALGEGRDCQRLGVAYVPHYEALGRVVVDVGGRPGCYWAEALPPATFGALDTATLAEFFRELALAAGFTLHLDILKAGPNPQQLLATLFKACGRALRAACTIDRRAAARGE